MPEPLLELVIDGCFDTERVRGTTGLEVGAVVAIKMGAALVEVFLPDEGIGILLRADRARAGIGRAELTS